MVREQQRRRAAAIVPEKAQSPLVVPKSHLYREHLQEVDKRYNIKYINTYSHLGIVHII